MSAETHTIGAWAALRTRAEQAEAERDEYREHLRIAVEQRDALARRVEWAEGMVVDLMLGSHECHDDPAREPVQCRYCAILDEARAFCDALAADDEAAR